MKANLLTTAFLAALLFVAPASIAHAQVTWNRDMLNPVVTGGGDGKWNKHVFMPVSGSTPIRPDTKCGLEDPLARRSRGDHTELDLRFQ
jgi:hypothetical protein